MFSLANYQTRRVSPGSLIGHKARSVFERYNIVSPGDLLDAARRLDAAATRRLDAAKNLTGTITGTIPASEASKVSHHTRK